MILVLWVGEEKQQHKCSWQMRRGVSLCKSVLPAEHWPDLELKVWALGDYTRPGVQGSMDAQQPQAILSSPQTQC